MSPDPMAPAKRPVGSGRIGAVGVALAVTTTALGLVGVRDALISAGALQGPAWIESAVEALDGLQPQWWLVPVGVVSVLVGLWLLSVALRPRPRTGVALRARTGVFLRPRDVATLAERAAEDVDGVLAADVTTGRRAVRIAATVTGDGAGVDEQVRDAVQRRLGHLDPPPRVTVSTRPGGAW